MPYWVVITEPTVLEPPGTVRAINRTRLNDGRISWLVEGSDVVSILAGLARGVVSVERLADEATDRTTINKW